MGEMGLSLDELRRLTPYQFRLKQQGQADKEDRHLERLAWHASAIISSQMPKGESISADQLLGRQPPPGEGRILSDEEWEHAQSEFARLSVKFAQLPV